MDVEHVGLKRRARPRDSAAESTSECSASKLPRFGDGGSRILLSCEQRTEVALGNSAPAKEFGSRQRSFSKDEAESSTSDHDLGSVVSCCSSNVSSEELNEIYELVDLEENGAAPAETSLYYGCGERRKMAPSKGNEESDGADSTMKSSDKTMKNSDPESRCNSVVEKKKKTVTEAEIESFFFVAEKENQIKLKEFASKYNFDFVNEAPLEGRYEWSKLKL